jgi:hypothetical protein
MQSQADQQSSYKSTTPEGIADRGEGKHNVQIGFRSIDKEVPEVGWRLSLNACFHCSWSHSLSDSCSLIIGEQVWNFSCVQKRVEILHKGFQLDLGVAKEEHRPLALGSSPAACQPSVPCLSTSVGFKG